jgi:hypothetical protein
VLGEKSTGLERIEVSSFVNATTLIGGGSGKDRSGEVF